MKKHKLGSLKVHSGVIYLGDPLFMALLEVPNVSAKTIEISATLLRNPSDSERVSELTLKLGNESVDGSPRKIGEVLIDSAKMIVVDQADFQKHWIDEGSERTGVISTAPDDTVLKLLTKRFKLKTVRVNRVRSEIIGPITEELEKAIEAYLGTFPEYAEFPYVYFRVDTDNSFRQFNSLKRVWDFMPVGGSDGPQMFVCQTGWGDGTYEVYGGYSGDIPQWVKVSFIS